MHLYGRFGGKLLNICPSEPYRLCPRRDFAYRLSHRPRDGSVVSSPHCMHDLQPEGSHGKPHRTTKILSHARRRGGLAARGARAAGRADAAHGVLHAGSADDPHIQARNTAFLQSLQQLGRTEGRSARIDIRWGAADADRFRTYVAELVSLAPDVILVAGSATVGPLLLATREPPCGLARRRRSRSTPRRRSGRGAVAKGMIESVHCAAPSALSSASAARRSTKVCGQLPAADWNRRIASSFLPCNSANSPL